MPEVIGLRRSPGIVAGQTAVAKALRHEKIHGPEKPRGRKIRCLLSKPGRDVDSISLFKGHIGFFLVGTNAGASFEPLYLTFGDGRVHGLHLDAKDSLNTLLPMID